MLWLFGGGWWRGQSSPGVGVLALLSPLWLLLDHSWMAELGAFLVLVPPMCSDSVSSFLRCLVFSSPAVHLLLRVCRSLSVSKPLRCARRSQVLVSGFVFRMAMVSVHSLVLGGASPSFDGAAPFVPRRGGNESPSKMEEGVFVSAGAHGDCVRASPPAASFRQGPAGVAVWCLFLSEGSSSSCCVP